MFAKQLWLKSLDATIWFLISILGSPIVLASFIDYTGEFRG